MAIKKEIQKDALWQGRKIKEGEFSSPELLEAYLRQIEAVEERINSLTSWDKEAARRQAKAVQRDIENKIQKHPLAGTVAVLKDNIATKSLPTECCSKILKGFVAGYDAHVVTCLKEAGVIILGKSNMDEFAMGNTCKNSMKGPCRNPWDLDRTPGGSSGGSCAAVAAHLASFALGSDTGGSIRQPSAYCGVVGIKPTYQRISRYGLIAYASSMDQIGPITRSVRDCAAVLECIGREDKRDAGLRGEGVGSYEAYLERPVQGMRVGIPKEFIETCPDEQIYRGIFDLAKVLKDHGVLVEIFSLGNTQTVIPAYYIIASAEASSNLARYDGVKYGYRKEGQGLDDMYKESRSRGFGEEVKKRIAAGAFCLGKENYQAYYGKAVKARKALQKSFAKAFLKYQVLLSPVSPHLPPRWDGNLIEGRDAYLQDIYTAGVNLAGLPAMSLPYRLSKEGLPLACQLIGNYFEEGQLLRLAKTLETVFGQLICPIE